MLSAGGGWQDALLAVLTSLNSIDSAFTTKKKLGFAEVCMHSAWS